jgi:hypothetical protein
MFNRVYQVYLHVKLVGLALLVLTNIVQFYLLPTRVSQRVYVELNRLFVYLLNPIIRVHGDPTAFQRQNLVVMSNHYDGVLDANLVYYLNNQSTAGRTLWTVVKANILCDADDTQFLLKLLAGLKTAFIRSNYFIPYVRGDKADGVKVKATLLACLHQGLTGGNVLIFPEGTTRKNGVPRDLKNGIFQLAAEQGLNILPVQLKFEKDIGTERGEGLKPMNLFNNVVDVYIHDVLPGAGADYLALKQKVLANLGGDLSPPAPPLGVDLTPLPF